MPTATEAEINLAVYTVLEKEARKSIPCVTVEVTGSYIASGPGGKKISPYDKEPILLPKGWNAGTVKRLAGLTLKQKFSDFVKIRTFLPNPRSEKASKETLTKGDVMNSDDKIKRERELRAYFADNHSKVEAVIGAPQEEEEEVEEEVLVQEEEGIEEQIIKDAEKASKKKKSKAVAKKKHKPGDVDEEDDRELDEFGLPPEINAGTE